MPSQPFSHQEIYILFKEMRAMQAETQMQELPTALFNKSPHYQSFLKNRRCLYRLTGKGLVLLKTIFSKKPKNPV